VAQLAFFGLAVAPGDIAADLAALFLVGAVVGAIEGEVEQGVELGFDAVEPRAVGRGVGDVDVVRPRPRPNPLIVPGRQVREKSSTLIAMRISLGSRPRTYRQSSTNRVQAFPGRTSP
jgi:hypothetical protein